MPSKEYLISLTEEPKASNFAATMAMLSQANPSMTVDATAANNVKNGQEDWHISKIFDKVDDAEPSLDEWQERSKFSASSSPSSLPFYTAASSPSDSVYQRYAAADIIQHAGQRAAPIGGSRKRRSFKASALMAQGPHNSDFLPIHDAFNHGNFVAKNTAASPSSMSTFGGLSQSAHCDTHPSSKTTAWQNIPEESRTGAGDWDSIRQGFEELDIASDSKFKKSALPSSRAEISPDTVIAETAEILKTILNDKTGYKNLLEQPEESAQLILDLLQMLLDYPSLDNSDRSSWLTALTRLSGRSGLYPRCFVLRDVVRYGSPVACGHFGEVWMGRFQEQKVCLKIIKLYQKSRIDHLLKVFSKEAILWSQLSHINVLPFYGIYYLGDAHGKVCLVSPWMEHGNICEYLNLNPSVDRLPLVSDIADGIVYLHQHNIVHGDLKGANILITNAGRACLADFGLSSVSDGEILKWTSLESTTYGGGTTRWQAPELIHPAMDDSDPLSSPLSRATEASDIYAFGCVFYEIFTGHVPFNDMLDASVIYKVVFCNERPPQPCRTSEAYKSFGLTDDIWTLVERCWHKHARNRPSAKEVVEELLLMVPASGKVRAEEVDAFSPSQFRSNMLVVPDESFIVNAQRVLKACLTGSRH